VNLFRFILAALAAVGGILLAIPLALLSFPFWIVAYLTRKGCRFFEAPSVPWDRMIEFESTVGWKPKANLDVYSSFVAGVFHWKTDAHGWRGNSSIEQSKVLIFGDSYAFGYAMDEEELFTDQNHQLCMKGIGAPGYNMVQSLLWMQKLSPYLTDKLVVWFICISNDFYDNLQLNMQGYKSPFLRRINGSEEWEIVTSHLSPMKWLYNEDRDQARMRKGRYVAAFGTSPLTERAYSACEFLLKQGSALCSASGGKLVVMTVPHMAQFNAADWEKTVSRFGDPKLFNRDLPNERIREICQKLEVPFVAGSSHLQLQDYILEDGHWNARGHQRIAEVLGELYSLHMNKSGKENQAIRVGSRILQMSQTTG